VPLGAKSPFSSVTWHRVAPISYERGGGATFVYIKTLFFVWHQLAPHVFCVAPPIPICFGAKQCHRVGRNCYFCGRPLVNHRAKRSSLEQRKKWIEDHPELKATTHNGRIAAFKKAGLIAHTTFAGDVRCGSPSYKNDYTPRSRLNRLCSFKRLGRGTSGYIPDVRGLQAISQMGQATAPSCRARRCTPACVTAAVVLSEIFLVLEKNGDRIKVLGNPPLPAPAGTRGEGQQGPAPVPDQSLPFGGTRR
jgi:hypothetical protein